ncbi:MAG: hypothetical protein AAFY84_12965 [Pseudomonadota bacterium]
MSATAVFTYKKVRERINAEITNTSDIDTVRRAGLAAGDLINAGREELLRQNLSGKAFAKKFSSLVDHCLKAVWDSVLPADAYNQVAIIATGGYGRSALAPYSDIDLLLLTQKETDTDNLVKAAVSPLWDAGLKLGYSVHTPITAMALVKSDIPTRTACLDARYLFGNRIILDGFLNRFDAYRKRTIAGFTKAKLEEQSERHDRVVEARYLSEPNIKEGRGGLRDIHLIHWLGRYRSGIGLGRNDQAESLLLDRGWAKLARAEAFMMTLRLYLHQLRGRADDALTYDIQRTLAEKLGYTERPGQSREERLMRHYHVNALEVNRLCRIYLARLDELDQNLLRALPRPVPKALLTDEVGHFTNIRLRAGRLDFVDTKRATTQPLDLVRLFRAYSKRQDIEIHPDALALIKSSAKMVTSKVRVDPDIARLFMASLLDARAPIRFMRLMTETGLLRKLVPSFAHLTGRVEVGLYRQYSLEEQTFQALSVLRGLRDESYLERHPIVTSLVKERPYVAAAILSILFHEMRSVQVDTSVEDVEKQIYRAVKPLATSNEWAYSISWCAARPLELSLTAERRDLGRARAIARFASRVGTVERLDVLLILSVSYLRVVSPDAWDERTRSQVRALYLGAKEFLKGGTQALKMWMEKRERAAIEAAIGLLDDVPVTVSRAVLADLAGEGVLNLPENVLARTVRMIAAAKENNQSSSISVVVEDGLIEVIVYASDRPYLIAEQAAAIGSIGASVRALQALTLSNNKVLDIFQLTPAGGQKGVVPGEDISRLSDVLWQVLMEEKTNFAAPRRPFADKRRYFAVPPRVRVDLDAADDCLVIEAEGLDRPGLLAELATSLAEIGVTIKYANIATYGERVVDTFYLQDAPGYKIANKRRIQSVERRLLGVLTE